MRHISQFVLVVAFAGLVGCGGSNQVTPIGNQLADSPGGQFGQAEAPIQYAQDFPASLPNDVVQPWKPLTVMARLQRRQVAARSSLKGNRLTLKLETQLIGTGHCGWRVAMLDQAT